MKIHAWAHIRPPLYIILCRYQNLKNMVKLIFLDIKIWEVILSIVSYGYIHHAEFRERSGSVVECLTRDRDAAGSSLSGVTALCP